MAQFLKIYEAQTGEKLYKLIVSHILFLFCMCRFATSIKVDNTTQIIFPEKVLRAVRQVLLCAADSS